MMVVDDVLWVLAMLSSPLLSFFSFPPMTILMMRFLLPLLSLPSGSCCADSDDSLLMMMWLKHNEINDDVWGCRAPMLTLLDEMV